MESLDGDRMKQHQALQQKLADKRRMRQEAMKTKHDSEMAKELLEQKKELADAERNAVSLSAALICHASFTTCAFIEVCHQTSKSTTLNQ